jgi:hypothetical protein
MYICVYNIGLYIEVPFVQYLCCAIFIVLKINQPTPQNLLWSFVKTLGVRNTPPKILFPQASETKNTISI